MKSDTRNPAGRFPKLFCAGMMCAALGFATAYAINGPYWAAAILAGCAVPWALLLRGGRYG